MASTQLTLFVDIPATPGATDMLISPLRRCNTCGKDFPPTLEFFIPHKECKDGLRPQCRACQATYNRNWESTNRTRRLPIRRAQYAERYGAIQREKERLRKEAYPIMVCAQRLKGGMRERAQKLGLPFDKQVFTTAFLLQLIQATPECPCCKKRFDTSFKGKN